MYVVYHKNPKHPDIIAGKTWAIDGLNEKWSKAEAEAHAFACDYAGQGIEYQIRKKAKREKTGTDK